jgi:phosphatidate phosphatase LPIN
MNTIENIVSKISSAFEFNKATLSGALDVIVIEHPDGTMVCTPFRVRFGKLQILKSNFQAISITVNGVLTSVTMKLSNSGEAYFPVQEDFSPICEESKSFSQKNSPSCSKSLCDNNRIKNEQILPKKGDYCDDLLADEEANEEDDVVQMSLCAHLWLQTDYKEKIFMENVVEFDEFQKNPWEIINHPNLLVKVGLKVYNKEEALPMILALIVYNRPLTPVARVASLPGSSHELSNKMSLLTLTSDSLRSLNLNTGKNEAVYTVNSSLQGEQKIAGRIYLWNSNCKIVISDIDGTITKSDVLGHVLTMMGKDWSHPGVVKLYKSIEKNGYKILYLSSRAIGQANTTRNFLDSLRQEGLELPDGPLIISHDRLFKSFVREVILKTPEKFKTTALNEIAELFPLDALPFYAGFGNRDTDAIAYRAVGVSLDNIFIINPKGNIFVFNDNVYLESYPEMTATVDTIFPPIGLN